MYYFVSFINVYFVIEHNAKDVASQEDEEEALRLAMSLSMQMDDNHTQAQTSQSSGVDSSGGSSTGTPFLDPDFVSRLLGSVDVDPNDPLIRAALAQINMSSQNPSGQNQSSEEDKDDPKPGMKRKDPSGKDT